MEKDKKNALKWMRFTGIAAQMGVIIFLGHLLGKYIDSLTNRNDEIFHKTVTLLSVFLAMALVIREVIKMGKNS